MGMHQGAIKSGPWLLKASRHLAYDIQSPPPGQPRRPQAPRYGPARPRKASWYVVADDQNDPMVQGAEGPQRRQDDHQTDPITASRWFVADTDVDGKDQDNPSAPAGAVAPGVGSGQVGTPAGFSDSATDPHAPSYESMFPMPHATPADIGGGGGYSGGGSAPSVGAGGGGGSYAGPYTPSEGVEQWRKDVGLGLTRNGLPDTPQMENQVLHQMQTESSGNPNAINNWDSNAKAGHPSQGLMQTIPSTFNQYHLPGDSTSITDPQANIDSAIDYGKATYGPTLMNNSGGGIGSGHGY